MNKPIEIFKNEKQLRKCAKYWQKKLFLHGWIIVPKICAPEDFEDAGNLGENSFDMVNKCCVIRILAPEYYGDRIMKYCAEKVLVHELLHCKYNWLCENGTYEEKYVDTIEHGLLEEMAKSLIMAKYDLKLSYFR